jgi:hypothetical protein
MSNLANLALDGGDPRMGEKNNPNQYALDHGHEAGLKNGFTIEAAQVHNDPNILFEEYLHYAEITRAEERAYEGNNIKRKEAFSLGGIIKNRFTKGHQHEINATVQGNQIVTTHNDWQVKLLSTNVYFVYLGIPITIFEVMLIFCLAQVYCD